MGRVVVMGSLVLGQQEDARTCYSGAWLPRKPGSPACIPPSLKEVSSIVASKQGSGEPASWESIQKERFADRSLWGCVNPPGLTSSHACAFSPPRDR